MTKGQKTTTKNNKKASKNKTIPPLRFDNGVEIPAKTSYIKDTKCFKINEINIDKIRASESRLYSKEHNSYKYYVFFYEHSDEYIPLKIILKDVVGYYNDYKDKSKYDTKYSAKRMNFRLNGDDSLSKVYDIFEHIQEKLGIDLNNFMYESSGEEYLKTIVSDETYFRKNKDDKINIIPNE